MADFLDMIDHWSDWLQPDGPLHEQQILFTMNLFKKPREIITAVNRVTVTEPEEQGGPGDIADDLRAFVDWALDVIFVGTDAHYRYVLQNGLESFDDILIPIEKSFTGNGSDKERIFKTIRKMFLEHAVISAKFFKDHNMWEYGSPDFEALDRLSKVDIESLYTENTACSG